MSSNRKLILFIILLVTLSITAYVVLVVIPTRLAERSYEGAKQIGKDIRELFHFTPKITVNHTIVIQQQTQILELATLSQKFQHQYRWKNTWMGSTKEINIIGTFDAKVGFDLQKKFSIQIENEKALVIFPEPQILSVEPLGDMKFEDEYGIWNWVHDEDRATAVNAFQKDAHKFAEQAAFISDAKQIMENKLKEILKVHVKEVEIQFSPPERIKLK